MELDSIIITGLFAISVALLTGVIAHYASSFKIEKDIKLNKLEDLGTDNILILTYYHNVISAIILFFKQNPINPNITLLQQYITEFEKINKPSSLSDIVNKTTLRNKIFIPAESITYDNLLKKTNKFKRTTLNHITVNSTPSPITFYTQSEINKITSDAKVILDELDILRSNIITNITSEYKITLRSSRKSLYIIGFIIFIISLAVIYLSSKPGRNPDSPTVSTINIKINDPLHSFQGTPYRFP